MSVLLDGASRVMIQGLTGRQAQTHVAYMRAYGTNVVCGVAPGRGGEHVDGIPVYDGVRAALREHEVDVSVLFVPGRFVRDAALDAIENGVPHVHILAEGVPHHDAACVLERARVRNTLVIGPNSQGMISPGKAKLGGTGGPEPERMFAPGSVGIVSRSGGMGAEIGQFLTRNGIGQSTYISIGGDLLIGTAFVPLLERFEADPQTRCVVIFGEAGTAHEEDVATFLAAGHMRKPLVAMIVGTAIEQLPRGLSFGHTSSLVGHGTGTASGKRALLRSAGALVADDFRSLLHHVRASLAQPSEVPA